MLSLAFGVEMVFVVKSLAFGLEMSVVKSLAFGFKITSVCC